MAEYIEREAAIRTAVEAVDAGLATTSGDLAEIRDDIPAADVAPVQHGRWLKNERFKQKCRKCSECGFPSYFEFNHCPNCGAKMDGRKEDG